MSAGHVASGSSGNIKLPLILREGRPTEDGRSPSDELGDASSHLESSGTGGERSFSLRVGERAGDREARNLCAFMRDREPRKGRCSPELE